MEQCDIAIVGAGMVGAATAYSHVVERLWHPCTYLLFPLSGAGFLLNSLPVQAQEVLLYLPMIHGLEYLREGFFGSHIIAIYDLGYMALCNTLLTLFGLAQIRALADSVIPE